MLTSIQIGCQTKLTREWDKGPNKRSIGGANNKPFRSKKLKIEARDLARKTDGGFYRAAVSVVHH